MVAVPDKLKTKAVSLAAGSSRMAQNGKRRDRFAKITGIRFARVLRSLVRDRAYQTIIDWTKDLVAGPDGRREARLTAAAVSQQDVLRAQPETDRLDEKGSSTLRRQSKSPSRPRHICNNRRLGPEAVRRTRRSPHTSAESSR